MSLEQITSGDIEPDIDRDMVRGALRTAGLSHVRIPAEHAHAYHRLIDAAIEYIREVNSSTARAEENQLRSFAYSSDRRRMYHNALCLALLGKAREELSKEQADQVSDFAAYLTGHDQYIGTW